MKSKLLQKRFPFIIIAVVLLAYGCTKIDTTSIGSGLLPIVDNVNTFDTTLEVSVRNYTDLQSDSVYVYPGTAHIIGQTNDPIFGTTKSNMYFQIGASSYPFTFPVKSDSLHFDSAVLVLKLAAIYGDTLTPQKIDVFPVTEDTFSYFKHTTSGATGKDTIIVRGAYRINQDIKYDQSRLLGTTTVMPADVRAQRKLSNKIDSVVSSELRIRLDDAFGLSFFTDAVNGAYTSDSAFKKFFNGFAVVPDISAGGNALMYFLSSTDTKLQLYHRVDKRDGTKDTTVQAFSFNSGNCRIANYVIRDRSAAEIAGHLDNNTDDQVMYLQGTPGTLARVTIPGIENMYNRTVHRAELVFKQLWTGPQQMEDNFPPGGYVYTEVFNTDSNKVIRTYPYYDSLIYNSSLSSIYSGGYFSYVGGTYHAALDNSSRIVGRYDVNITRYVQSIITRHYKNYPLQLSIPYLPARFVALESLSTPLVPLGSGRLKAGGGGHPQYKMTLRIIYSKIK